MESVVVGLVFILNNFVASMGPRHFSRGKIDLGVKPTAFQLKLQWGHGISAVESSWLGMGHGGEHQGFNGATAFQPWKAT